MKNLPLPYLRLRQVGLAGWKAADRRIFRLKTKEDILAYQEGLRKKFCQVFGPLPDTTKIIRFHSGKKFFYQDISVSRVILESEKGYLISGLLFRHQKIKGKLPGIVWASGHSEEASFNEFYLQFSLQAARCGFLVFAFDPPGQGCRREVFLPSDHPVYWSPCNQHQHLGVLSSLAGYQLAHFFVCDCITAVSFLLQQQNVDTSRIGFAGQSGGGLQTYLAMGADTRIKVAVPSQATSTRRGAFQQLQVRDMEQCFFHCWKEGMDHHEMTLLFAPRPVRIVAEFGYPDQFDVYQKLAPIYEKLGFPENIEITSAGPDHHMRRTERELTLSWFIRHLSPASSAIVEDWSGYSEFVSQIKQEQSKINLREKGIISFCRQVIKNNCRTWKGVSSLKKIPFLQDSFQGKSCEILDNTGKLNRIKQGNFRLIFSPGYEVPVKIWKGRGRKTIALIVDEKGMDSVWAKRMAKRLKKENSWVLLLDVFNCGRLRTNLKPCRQGEFLKRSWRYYSPDVYHACDAFMAGVCPVGLAMEEIYSLLVSLKITERPLNFSGRGWPAVSLILLSAHLPRVGKCLVEKIPSSYQELFESGWFWFNINLVIPGILKYTDLPVIISHNKKTSYQWKNQVKPDCKRGNNGTFRYSLAV